VFVLWLGTFGDLGGGHGREFPWEIKQKNTPPWESTLFWRGKRRPGLPLGQSKLPRRVQPRSLPRKKTSAAGKSPARPATARKKKTKNSPGGRKIHTRQAPCLASPSGVKIIWHIDHGYPFDSGALVSPNKFFKGCGGVRGRALLVHGPPLMLLRGTILCVKNTTNAEKGEMVGGKWKGKKGRSGGPGGGGQKKKKGAKNLLSRGGAHSCRTRWRWAHRSHKITGAACAPFKSQC